MGPQTEKRTMDDSKQKAAAKTIGTIFVVTTGLELAALPLLCYEFVFKERVLQQQLAHFRGDPRPGPLAAALPGKVAHMHERALSCILYTGFTLVKQFLNIILLIGHKKESPWLARVWVAGFPAMHAATSAVLLWFGVPWYFDVDLVVVLALLQLIVISSVLVTYSALVLWRGVRHQRRAVAIADTPTS